MASEGTSASQVRFCSAAPRISSSSRRSAPSRYLQVVDDVVDALDFEGIVFCRASHREALDGAAKGDDAPVAGNSDLGRIGDAGSSSRRAITSSSSGLWRNRFQGRATRLPRLRIPRPNHRDDAFGEGDSGPEDEVLDGAGDQDLARLRAASTRSAISTERPAMRSAARSTSPVWMPARNPTAVAASSRIAAAQRTACPGASNGFCWAIVNTDTNERHTT